jgi:hypothetical protein
VHLILKTTIKYFLIIAIIFCTGKNAAAQNMIFKGTVTDTVEKKSVANAVGMAVRIKDSVLLGFTRSDANGNFLLNTIPIDTIELTISHPNYGDKLYFIFGSATNFSFDLNKIIMPPKTNVLEEVTIFAYKDPVYFLGDTLVYTADSFKVKPNATVEDLLKKLPGVKVDANGKITVQGKQVDQLLVDGDEFFGTDPNTALKNLNANTIENVKVYEQKNENTTEDGKETVQVMNLELKDDAKKGYFGKMSAASDFQNFHEGNVLFNKFNSARKISVFGLASNTPNSRFDFGDLYKYGLDNEYEYSRDEDDGYSYYSSNGNANSGYPQNYKGGFYYNEKFGKKTKLGLNYTYNSSTLSTKQESYSQYFLTDTTYNTQSFYNNFKKGTSHSFNLDYEQTIDSLTEFELESKLKLTSGRQNNSELTDFVSSLDTTTRRTTISNISENIGYNVNTTAKLRRKFKKADRTMRLVYNFNTSNDEGSGILKSYNKYYQLQLPNDSIDQQKTSNTISTSHSGTLVYEEPITKKIKLEFEYNISFNTATQDKIANNFFNGEYSLLDTIFTNNFKNEKLNNRFSLKYIFENSKIKFTAGMRLRNISVNNTNLVSNTVITQSVNNILPFASYRYKASDTKSMSINYRTSSNLPSINNLQPVPNNNNPNSIFIGNPNLLPTFEHSLGFSFNSFKPLSGKSVWSGMNTNYINNAFANSTRFDSLGRTVSQTINVDGNYNANIYIGGETEIFKGAITMSPYFFSGYDSRTNYINGQKNITKNFSADLSSYFQWTNDTITIGISVGADYNVPQSSLSTLSNKPYTNQRYSANFSWMLPKKFTIETNLDYSIQANRSAGFNTNILIWGASLSKAFLKNENLILAFEANDILNQNLLNNRDVNENVITDNKTQIITRFFMLRLTWKFNSNKIKEEDGMF